MAERAASSLKSCYDLFLVAGEMSGDDRGYELLQELYKKNPQLQVTGIGGNKMESAGMNILFPMTELQVMGFIDVFLSLPKLIRFFKKTVQAILQINPRMVITIDYPGFNLRLVQALRKKGFKGKICHYICPSVWAWGKKRIDTMAKHLDLLLCILPFEKELFSHTHLQVEYIGHPLVDKIHKPQLVDSSLIVLYPGSREKEIRRNLPFLIRLIKQLKISFPHLSYGISISQERYRALIQKELKGEEVSLMGPLDHQSSAPLLAVAKCGTIALELALKETPSIIIYAMSQMDIWIAQYLFKIALPFYALPNLISKKQVFPELIAHNLKDEDLFKFTKKQITDKKTRHNCIQDCQKLRNFLTVEKGLTRAAQLILSLIQG